MNAQDTVVDRCWREFAEVAEMLQEAGELSLYNTMNDLFRKILLLTAASHFESEMQKSVESYVLESASGDELVASLVQKKAISRQYHTWFDWSRGNANQFFSLFGRDFLEYMKSQIENGNPTPNSVRAFIEIGENRNRLVHQNFGEFQMEKSMQEVYELYSEAKEFAEKFPSSFREFSRIVQERRDG